MIVDVRSSSSDESDVLVVEPYPSERGL